MTLVKENETLRMKIKINIFFVLLLSFYLTGCDIQCQGFDTKFLSWMPYELNDKLVYFNQNNDTIVFTINQKEIFDGYETSFKNRKYCTSEMSIGDASSDRGLGVNIINNSELIILSAATRINNNSGSIYLETENLENEIKELTINDKIFEETIILELDTTTQNMEIWKIIIAKNYGIVQFFDRKSNEIWTLKTN